MAKKIGAIVSLSLIGIIIIVAIVMANVKIDYSVKCLKPDVVYVQTTGGTVRANDTQKDKIVDLISNASKENSLTALFNGKLGKKAELVTEKATLSSNPSNFYVRYYYNTKQDLVVNNKEYKNADGQIEKYEELVFVVNQVEGETEFRVYVILDSGTSVNNYSYYFKLTADFEELYKYLESNF